MKKTAVIMMIWLSFTVVWSQTGKEVDSKISNVTVYLQGAHVTHVARTRIPSGESVVVFPGLSRNIDASSIQVIGSGNFTLKGVNPISNYLRKSKLDKKTDSLENLIKVTQNEINLTQARREVLSEELSLLNANKNLGGTGGTSVGELRTALQFYKTEVTRIKKEQIKENDDLAELNTKLNALRNQLNNLLRQKRTPLVDVELTVFAAKSGDVAIEVSYFTGNAGWSPLYDVRVSDINSPIDLSYKAEVHQNTGEDWNNVKLSFSNASPNQGGTAPKMGTWYLNYVQPTRSRNTANYKPMPMKARSMAMDAEVEPMAAEESFEMETMKAEMVESQTSFHFVVQTPYTVKSNATKVTVDLNQYKIPALYQYYALPKLDPDAFLMARVYDWDQYALLGGQMNLYFEDGYVGKSFLDPQSSGDTLDLSLGRDKSIVVERKKVDQYTENKTLGGNKVASRGYSIEVRNKKGQEINLLMFDQVPVSANSSIEVRDIKSGGADYNQQTGELKWKITLAPGKTDKKEFRYEVKYPKDAVIRLD